MRDNAFTQALANFKALSPPDRREIEKHLSPEQKSALRAALSPPKPPKPKRAEEPAQAKPDLKGLSPNLARRVTEILIPASDQAAKPAVREAIRAILTRTGANSAP